MHLLDHTFNKIDLSVDEIIKKDPFGVSRIEKEIILLRRLNLLTFWHNQNCDSYRRILLALGVGAGNSKSVNDIPFIPVRLFKELELRSTNEVFRTLSSSGTTGQQVSKIYLDKQGASHQTKALAKIVGNVIGTRRLPIMVIDSEATVSSRERFSARAAGIHGFSMFGSKRLFALDDNMELRVNQVADFIDQHRETGILIFGFTFMVWQHLFLAAEKAGLVLDLSKGILIHGGGWKKLAAISVTNEVFRMEMRRLFGIVRIHDYFGMVEQTGTIFIECELGHLHASTLSDVVIRDPVNFSVAPFGKRGIVQTLSALPESYPGHSLLTEDEGLILGEDDCPCGRLGKYFRIFGRLANAEIRGCSDTYAQQF